MLKAISAFPGFHNWKEMPFLGESDFVTDILRQADEELEKRFNISGLVEKASRTNQ